MAKQAEKGITWCNETWNPIRGCSRVSEGCRLCYAERVAARFSGPGMAYEGLAKMTAQGEPRWTGVVRLIEKHLKDPVRWKRPRRIFVNSMSDLFHEDLAVEDIYRIFGVMAAAPHHQFQVLTKRAERMHQILTINNIQALIEKARREISPEYFTEWNVWNRWPLPNVWMGVSCENQNTADERIPWLLQTPAAVRWVSYEPALEPVDFTKVGPMPDGDRLGTGLFSHGEGNGIDWIVIGGESGHGARPFDINWARNTIAQCKAAGTACFVKQLGAMPYEDADWYSELPPLSFTKNGVRMLPFMNFKSKKASDISEWPDDLQVREYPNA